MQTQNPLSLPPVGRATQRQLSGVGIPDFPHLLPLASKPQTPIKEAEIARKFETLIAATLLRAARAADLGDDGMGASAGPIRDMIDNSRAEAIARAAPLGVARLLAKERATQ